MFTAPFVGIHPEIPYNDEDQIAIFGQQPQRGSGSIGWHWLATENPICFSRRVQNLGDLIDQTFKGL